MVVENYGFEKRVGSHHGGTDLFQSIGQVKGPVKGRPVEAEEIAALPTDRKRKWREELMGMGDFQARGSVQS